MKSLATMMGARAVEEEVALQRIEKKKDKRNKETENGLGLKTVHGETTTAEGEGNGVMLRTSNKKSKKKVEKDHTNGRSMKINEDHRGAKEGISGVKEHEQSDKRKKKKEKKEKKFKDTEVGKDKESKGSKYRERKGIPNIKEREESDQRKKKKEKKERKFKDTKVGEDKVSKGSEHCEREGIYDKEREESDKQKKKKVKKDRKECSDVEHPNTKSSDEVSVKGKNNVVSNQDLRTKRGHIDVGGEENLDYRNNGKSKRKKKKNGNEGDCKEILIKESVGKGKSLLDLKEVADTDGHFSSSNKKRDREEDVETDTRNKKKKKKTKLVEDFDNEDPKTGNTESSRTDHSRNSKPKHSSKRVKFSGNVEVFPSSDVTDVREENQEDNLVRGKRFSRKEDTIIKDAISNYIEEHGLGEKGLEMILKCSQYPEVKNCWKEIGASLPWRPYEAVYYRAHILLERGVRGFTEEEKALVMKFQKEHGSNWKELADALGKHRFHVKDAWRRMKNGTNRGHWSQEEYQTLFDLVNMDLRMKASEEKKSKHGMLRDNISWTAISDTLGTRSNHNCCIKWYNQLTSPMVKAGEWADTDDYKLLNELLMLDACCVEDVDWDNLLEDRSGDVCLKRWKQMVHHIGTHGLNSFPDQVEVLAKRYCPELVETREAFDSRPVVQ